MLKRRRRLPFCVWHIRELFDDVGGEMHIPACGGRLPVRRLLKSFATPRGDFTVGGENILESRLISSVVEIAFRTPSVRTFPKGAGNVQ
ncbi:MAG: hypothetical protein U0992_04395 [Planctomycetaceae bacterium]